MRGVDLAKQNRIRIVKSTVILLWIAAMIAAVSLFVSLPATVKRWKMLQPELSQLNQMLLDLDREEWYRNAMTNYPSAEETTLGRAINEALLTIEDPILPALLAIGRAALPGGWTSIDHEVRMENVATGTVNAVVAAIGRASPGVRITRIAITAGATPQRIARLTLTVQTLIRPDTAFLDRLPRDID